MRIWMMKSNIYMLPIVNHNKKNEKEKNAMQFEKCDKNVTK